MFMEAINSVQYSSTSYLPCCCVEIPDKQIKEGDIFPQCQVAQAQAGAGGSRWLCPQ